MSILDNPNRFIKTAFGEDSAVTKVFADNPSAADSAYRLAHKKTNDEFTKLFK